MAETRVDLSSITSRIKTRIKDHFIAGRNAWVSSLYSKGGDFESYGEGLQTLAKARAQSAVSIISQINLPVNPEGKITILSPSANKGGLEKELQLTLGGKYQVIAGDISDAICQGPKEIPKVRSDVYHLPFADLSMAVILDYTRCVAS